MEKLSIILFDQDVGYSMALARRMESSGCGWNVRIAQDRVEAEQMLTGEGIWLILFSDQQSPFRCPPGVRQVISTTDHVLAQRGTRDGITVVFKYEPVDTLIRKLKQLRGQNVRLQGSQILGFYSPVCASGKTALALTAGRILAENSLTLYTNFEELSGIRALYEPEKPSGGLSAALFDRIGGTLLDSLSSRVNHWHRLDILDGVRTPEDLLQAGEEMLTGLITDIAKDGHYSTVIVDMSSADHPAAVLLPVCSRIYLPVRNDGISASRIKLFYELLGKRGLGELRTRIVTVQMPALLQNENLSSFLDDCYWGDCGRMMKTLLCSDSQNCL